MNLISNKTLRRVAALATSLLLLHMSLATSARAEEERLTRDVFAMDTYMSLAACGPHAEAALDAATEEIHRLDALLSTGREDSEVSALNAALSAGNAARPVSLSEDAAALMKKSLLLYEETEGAFDITIYPLMQLWGFPTGEYRVPSVEELQETLARVGSEAIQFDEATGETAFLKEGVAIDFGGIAKGYTSARIMQIYRDEGVTSGLVSLGGNVQALGTKPDGSLWKVAVQSPEEDGSYLGIAQIADEAVITSGGYERYFEENGTTYHHILDPATGYPAAGGLLSVTIISPDGTLADGLSTSLFVMGEERAAAFWRNHREAFDMVLLTEDGRLLASEGLRDSFTSDYEIEWVA